MMSSFTMDAFIFLTFNSSNSYSFRSDTLAIMVYVSYSILLESKILRIPRYPSLGKAGGVELVGWNYTPSL